MRIAIVSFRTSEYGGVERYAFELVKYLSEQAEVHLFTNRISGKTKATVHLVAALGKKDLFSVNSFMVFLKGSLKEKSFDIIHSMGPLYLEPDIVTAHICQKRLLSQKGDLFRDFSLFRKSYWDVRTHTATGFQKISFNNAKQVIAVSASLAEELEREYGIKEPVVIHPGIGKIFFKRFDKSIKKEKREEIGIADNSTVILFVGGQWERKGLKYIIQALPFLPQHIMLLVVGKGNRKRYEKIAKENGVTERIIFAGFQKNIIDYYSVSDIFVLPSFYEPFGYPVLEAMAMGLPVIASRNVGASELIDDGKTGYIIQEPALEKAISSRVKLLIERGTHSFAKKAEEKAKEFLWEKKINEIMNLYEETLECKG